MSDILSQIEQGLLGRGLSWQQAQGVTAGIYAESGGNPSAVNPSSGAFGIGQWLGSRQKQLFAQFGPNPNLNNQLDYLVQELNGGDPGGKSVLGASSPASVLSNYITKFMRPAAGPETTGDISRGTSYLSGKYAGATGAPTENWNTLGDYIYNLTGVNTNDAGTAIANAPGAVINKIYGGLNLSQWFGRTAFAVLAILLIAVALLMLSKQPIQQIAAKVPPLPA